MPWPLEEAPSGTLIAYERPKLRHAFANSKRVANNVQFSCYYGD